MGGDILSCPDFAATAANAAALLAKVLGVTHTMALELAPDGSGLRLQGGVGWGPGMVGHGVFATDRNSLFGLSLHSPEPVIVENFRTESRFAVPPGLSDYGLMSGVCMSIPCAYQTFGVLAAFSTEAHSFSPDDLSCLRVIAGMLAVSSGCRRTSDRRHEDQKQIAQAKQEWEATVDALPHFVCLLDDRRRIVRANRSMESWFSAPAENVRGHTIHELLHPGCGNPSCYMLTLCDNAWVEVLSGRSVMHEVDDKVLQRHLDIQIRPIVPRPGVGTGQTSMAVVVFQDITKLKHAEDVLKRSNDQLEQLVQSRTIELVRANRQASCELMERQRIEEELRRSENEMRVLSMQLLTAQEMERKRIASELHDGLGQSLSAIKFCMENAIGLQMVRRDDFDIGPIRDVIPRLQAAIDEVRRISMNLRPSTLDDLGILPTIAWFCREFRSVYSDIEIDTRMDISEDEVPIPLKTVIYRILQEALNNIARHARARSARIHLRRNGSDIEFLVQDNGAGFEINSSMQRGDARKGSGIPGMRERTEFSGGIFSIASDTGVGTTIRALWPCPR